MPSEWEAQLEGVFRGEGIPPWFTQADCVAFCKAGIIQEFPETFGLRAFPERNFRINPGNSYIERGKITLYLDIESDGRWVAFGKGSPTELRREIVR